MICLDFRRCKLIDPRHLSEEALAHLAECAHCRAFAREIDEVEARLTAAAMPAVPRGLEERVLLAHQAGTRRRVRGWAAAAGVLLIGAIGFAHWMDSSSKDYAVLAIEHVVHEPEALAGGSRDDAEFFRRVLSDFGGTMTGSLGKVRYIKLCAEPEGTGWHIVLDTEHGPATLMLMPGKKVSTAVAASRHGWHAQAQPGGRGYYAVVSSTPERTAAVKELVQQRVQWNF